MVLYKVINILYENVLSLIWKSYTAINMKYLLTLFTFVNQKVIKNMRN